MSKLRVNNGLVSLSYPFDNTTPCLVLFRWWPNWVFLSYLLHRISAECRIQTADCPDLPGALCEAMAALQDRSVLFKYTLDEFCAARRTTVVRSFIHTLTRGGEYMFLHTRWLGGCRGKVTWWVRRNGGLVGAEEWWLGYCLAWSIMSGTISLLHSKVRPVFVVRSD